jgi:hypothetical protein
VNHLESTKTVVGSTVTSAAGTATLTIDTLGYDYASVDVIVAVSATPANTAASILNVLTLAQGDASNAVTSTVYTVAAPAASVAVTAQPSVVRFDVDCRGKSRYLKVDATPATSLATTIVARLGKGEIGPESAAAKGALAKYSG